MQAETKHHRTTYDGQTIHTVAGNIFLLRSDVDFIPVSTAPTLLSLSVRSSRPLPLSILRSYRPQLPRRFTPGSKPTCLTNPVESLPGSGIAGDTIGDWCHGRRAGGRAGAVN